MLRRLLAVLLTVFAARAAHARQPLSIDIQQAPGEQARALDPIEFTLMVSLPLGTENSAPKQPAKPANSTGDGGAATLPAENTMSIISVKIAPAGVLMSDYAKEAKCSFKQQGIRDGQSIAVPCILYPKSDDIANRLVPGLGAIFPGL